MSGRGSAALSADLRGDAQTYCLVPVPLAESVDSRLAGSLVARGIAMVVERRRRARRQHGRRVPNIGPPGGGRRAVLNDEGRRIADRRGGVVPVIPPALPSFMEGVADRLRFVRVERASEFELASARSLRLVARFQAGDEQALAELYGEWLGSLLGFFEGRLRDRYAAEDAVHDIVVRLLGKGLRMYAFPAHVPFQAWLFRIARNALTDELRRRERVSVLDPEAIAERRERERLGPDVAERVERWALEGALARLPERERQALTLRFIGDLRVSEIAWMLGTSQGAISEALRRGLQTLPRYVAAPSQHRRVLRSSMRRRSPRLPVLWARRMALLPS
jgi:RNA polymerase sigma-70 factor (ECF subfamily)